MSAASCAWARWTASCALVRSSKWATMSAIAFAGVERLEHVLADEVGQVADRLHRDGLVEQLHRLLGLDAEAAAEVLAVLGEPVVDPDPVARPQPLAQRVMSVPKSAKSPLTDEVAVGGDVEPVRLAADVAVLQPEDLGQGDRLVVALVGEDPEDDAELRGVPQRDGPSPR